MNKVPQKSKVAEPQPPYYLSVTVEVYVLAVKLVKRATLQVGPFDGVDQARTQLRILTNIVDWASGSEKTTGTQNRPAVPKMCQVLYGRRYLSASFALGRGTKILAKKDFVGGKVIAPVMASPVGTDWQGNCETILKPLVDALGLKLSFVDKRCRAA